MRQFSGTKCKAARRDAELTQTQLAYALGVGSRTVKAWETGHKTPRIERLPQIAAALGVTIDDLFEEAQS